MGVHFLKASILRNIDGEQVCLGNIDQTFVVDSGQLLEEMDQFLDGIDTFLDRLNDAIAAAMFQAISVGCLDEVEIELDIDNYDPDPISFSVENPAVTTGYYPNDLGAKLSEEEKESLKGDILIVSEEMAYFSIKDIISCVFIPKVLRER